MPAPKFLIVGTCYIDTDLKAWLARQWVAAALATCPTAQLVLVDSASPIQLPSCERLSVVQLGDNIGHLQSTGRDGWGRAMTAAIAHAVRGDWDWVGFWDADVLMVRSLADMVGELRVTGAQAAGCIAMPYMHWVEGIFVFSRDWLARHDVASAYDWESMRLGIFPEDRIRNAIGPDMKILPLIGMRDDSHELTQFNIWRYFPIGIDYLTHCKDKDVYRAVMRRYGVSEVN